MSSIPFINKYQPHKIKDFEQLDEEVVTLIDSLIQMNSLNILLLGDSGSGKTSIINAIIREYYRSSGYNAENILVLNSLKDQGISYYRNEVKIFCQTCSLIPGKKKIVLLDDIDLINEQGQQVFRNFIDKFSHNVHFISSCTNIQKTIESLQSRNFIIKINPLNNDCLFKIMNKIKTAENITMDEDAERFVINISNQSVRLLVNYIEKIKILNMHVDLEIANKLCSNISFHYFNEYIHCALQNELVRAIHILYDIYDQGYSVLDIYDSLFSFIKTTALLSEHIKYKLVSIICKYINLCYCIHENEVELSLFTNNVLDILHSSTTGLSSSSSSSSS